MKLKYKYSDVCDKYPLSLEIELLRGCNIWPPCPMCGLNAIAGDNGTRPMKNLDKEIIEQNRDLFLNSHNIFFCGLGELLLSKSFSYYLDNFDPNTPFSFFSNGQLLDRDIVERLIPFNIGDIGFSIDAGTEETYRKIRGHGSYTLEKTLDNIAYLIKRFKESRKETDIMLLAVIMKINYLELPILLENGIRIGVKHFKTWHMRKGTDIDDYRDHVRNDFHFNYLEQSILENKDLYEDFKVVREKCYEIADKNNVTFETEYNRNNEYFF
jgi:MoaA/NifB/PqqE/SkfB family radical SAM enzyme